MTTIEDIHSCANNLLSVINSLEGFEKEIKPLKEMRQTLEECLEPFEDILASAGYVRDGLTGEEFIKI